MTSAEKKGETSSTSTKKKPSSSKKTSSGHLSEKVEDAIATLPNMEVSRLIFLLQSGQDSTPDKTKAQLMEIIQRDSMTPTYEKLCKELNWSIDSSLLDRMKQSNLDELKHCDEQLMDATENLGDIEVLDALFSKATLYSRIGDKEAAILAFEVASEKPQSISQKIQVALHLIRLGLFFNDFPLVETSIEKARVLIDQGGDWDRRNRLKVYEGCYLLMTREFHKAANLFQQSIATFTAEELMSYQTMTFYCILSSVLTVSRVELRKNIIDSPEIRAVIQPVLEPFLHGLYECNYRVFFQSIVDLQPFILQDRYLSRHVRYIYREFRVLAYTQFLEAYKSVTIDSMAKSFGTSVEFLDQELSRFISAGRLNAKIDKVGGIIETNRPDLKNTQYQAVIKKGDFLLNRIQKLARVTNV